MPLAFSPALENILSLLNPPNATLDRTNLEPNKQTRTPIHVLYGGAHLFKRDAVNRLGKLARDVWARYAPDASTFAKALDLPLTETLQLAHARTTQKLIAEPIEDLRIDFEDGFGLRPDAEEDATAIRCALEVARRTPRRNPASHVGCADQKFRQCTQISRSAHIRSLLLNPLPTNWGTFT